VGTERYRVALLKAPPFELRRDRRPWGEGIEEFTADEAAFYGGRVAEGICPVLHDESSDGEDDIVVRRLIPGRGENGEWAQCEDETCGALWHLAHRAHNGGDFETSPAKRTESEGAVDESS